MMSFVRVVLLIAFINAGLGRAQDVTMRWCITSAEQTKCDAFKNAMAKVGTALSKTIQFSCVQASDATECMKKIEAGQADLITLDGGQIYFAGKDHGMVPIMGEDYGEAYGTTYYGVAVIRSNNTDQSFDMNSLKGKKSCHTGAGKTAGWNVPIGFLLKKKYMTLDSTCNPYVAAGKFFSESCVPNSNLAKFNPNDKNPVNLCALCEGGCSSTRFAGYHGAFKCMAEGVGDVAFIKHTTVKEMVETKPPMYGALADYKYLCKGGGRKDIGQHISCNLANVAAHAVMTKKGNQLSNYKQILTKASEMYGAAANSSEFDMFQSRQYGGKDLMFKDSTKALKDVGEKNSYEKWLGADYTQDIEAINTCDKDTTGKTAVNRPVAVLVLFFVSLLLFGA